MPKRHMASGRQAERTHAHLVCLTAPCLSCSAHPAARESSHCLFHPGDFQTTWHAVGTQVLKKPKGPGQVASPL